MAKICHAEDIPGYVIVKMIAADESWYVIRNTRVLPVSWAGIIPLPMTR